MTRPAGIPNNNKRGLKAQLRAKFGKDFDVVMMMGQNCVTLHKIAMDHAGGKVTMAEDSGGKMNAIDASTSAKMAIDALEKLAQYVEPKLKAIEVSGDSGGPLVIKWLNG
jgi:hypothetical protein